MEAAGAAPGRVPPPGLVAVVAAGVGTVVAAGVGTEVAAGVRAKVTAEVTAMAAVSLKIGNGGKPEKCGFLKVVDVDPKHPPKDLMTLP